MTTNRQSTHEFSRIFSLGNVFGDSFVTEMFETPSVTAVPILVEFDTGFGVPDGFSVDPSGFRHLITHPQFKKILASGADVTQLEFGPLDFGITNVSSGIGISCTRCMVFRAEQFDCSTTRISDMKVWASDLSDFLIPESFEIIFDTRTGNQFPSGFGFSAQEIFNTSKHLPRSLPESQNLRRQDGAANIHGSGDLDVSEYILLAVASSGVNPLGEYLGNPQGFNLRVSYNLDNLFILFD